MTNRYPFRIGPPPVPAQRAPFADMQRIVERYTRQMAERYAMPRYMLGADGRVEVHPPAKAKPHPRRGDVVRMRATSFYVSKVNDDGTLVLAESPDAFAAAVQLGNVHPSRIEAVTKPAPAEPMVGDTITGAAVRRTPWKRGTVLRDVNPADTETPGERFVLLASGEWLNVDRANEPGVKPTFAFDQFDDGESFVVEYAPGKDTR